MFYGMENQKRHEIILYIPPEVGMNERRITEIAENCKQLLCRLPFDAELFIAHGGTQDMHWLAVSIQKIEEKNALFIHQECTKTFCKIIQSTTDA
jgi:lipid A disaccharide synthetase